MEHQNTLQFINLATNKNFGSVQISSDEDIRIIMVKLKAASKIWNKTKPASRTKKLKKIQEYIVDNMDSLAAVISNSTGKSRQDGLIEIFVFLQFIQDVIKNGPKWLKTQKVPTGLQFFKKAYTIQKPYGTAAIISPWNYPFTLTMIPLASALAAGNTAVVKTSEATPAVGAKLEEMMEDLGLSDICKFVHGDGRVGAAVIQNKPDIIHVTGAVNTGKIIAKAASEYLIPIILELGGKDPVIVLEDADIEAAAKWGSWGGFFNSGQTCMSPERVYVVEEIYDTFLESLISQAKDIQVGFSEEKESPFLYGSITTKIQAQIVTDHINDAVDKGAYIHIGGLPNGMYMEPTIISGITSDMKLLSEETFGATLPIIKVKDQEEAIALSNQHSMGLSASVWTEDLERAKFIAEQLEVGSVNINDTLSHYGIPQLPFGGVKESGYGRVMGKEGLLNYSQTISVMHGKPRAYDIGTILRTPEKYRISRAIMKITVGASLKQRFQGIKDFLRLLVQPSSD